MQTCIYWPWVVIPTLQITDISPFIIQPQMSGYFRWHKTELKSQVSNARIHLQIKYLQKRDSGMYECQVSTQPVRSFFVRLNILGKVNESMAYMWPIHEWNKSFKTHKKLSFSNICSFLYLSANLIFSFRWNTIKTLWRGVYFHSSKWGRRYKLSRKINSFLVVHAEITGWSEVNLE